MTAWQIEVVLEAVGVVSALAIFMVVVDTVRLGRKRRKEEALRAARELDQKWQETKPPPGNDEGGRS